MLLLRRHASQNVALYHVRRFSNALAPLVADRPNNAFISYNPEVPSITHKHPDFVSGCDRVPAAPEYHGFSVAVKDNICTLDYPTTCASRILDGFQSPYEATVVTRLKQRGMRIVGKTNMDEFGMGSHSTHSCCGPVVQHFMGPRGEEISYSAGGSSGGSAVAVQQGMSTVALGTDTGGSVRLPAAWCGIVGFKPSYGAVSRWGVIDYANSLDTVGIFAKTAEEADFVFDAICYPDNQDPTSVAATTAAQTLPKSGSHMRQGFIQHQDEVDPKHLTIGVPVDYNIAEISPLVRGVWQDALATCLEHGHKVVPISLPTTKSSLSAYYVLAPAEAASNLAKYDGVRYGTRAVGADGAGGVLFSMTRAMGLGTEVQRRILLGSYSLSADAVENYFIQAQKVRRLIQMEFNMAFAAPHPLLDASLPPSADTDDSQQSVCGAPGSKAPLAQQGVDIILCPTAPTPPPQLKDIEKQTAGDAYINDVFTVPASLAGLPAVSVPWGPNATLQRLESPVDPGKNVGLQVIGQYGCDRQVLRFAKRLEEFRDARHRT